MSITRSSWLFKITAILGAVCVGNSAPCRAEQPSAPQVEMVEIPVSPLPFILKGFLRRPKGTGTAPAVVLLPGCGKDAKSVDENWGTRISSWGYVTLTIDSFGPRCIKNCHTSTNADYSDLAFDAYRGLNFLIQRRLAHPKRAALVGFAWGAVRTLSAVERGAIERASQHKFRAAAGFYPFCDKFSGAVTVPTLILIGGRDDWATADACRKMAAGEDDVGISRQKGEGAAVRLIVYPDAYYGFDRPSLRTPTEVLGHHLEFNQSAGDQSSQALREFLGEQLEAVGNP